jgi:hypothetical protein
MGTLNPLNLDEICGQFDTGFAPSTDNVVSPIQKELSRKPSIKRESSPKTKKILLLEDRVKSVEKIIK